MNLSTFKKSVTQGATFFSMALLSVTLGLGLVHAMEFEPDNREHWSSTTRQTFGEIEDTAKRVGQVRANMETEEVDVSLAHSETPTTLSPEILKQIGHGRCVPALGFTGVDVINDGKVVVWGARALLTTYGDPSPAIHQFSTVVSGANLRAHLQNGEDPAFIRDGRTLTSYATRIGAAYSVTSTTGTALKPLRFMEGPMGISERDPNLGELLFRFKASLSADRAAFVAPQKLARKDEKKGVPAS